MLPTLGLTSLWLALACSIFLAIKPFAIGSCNSAIEAQSSSWRDRSAYFIFLFVLVAFGGLTLSFVGKDFSVKLVTEHSNSLLPLHYRIAATWGSHEGSILLWALFLGAWTAAVARFSTALPTDFRNLLLSTLGCINTGILSFTLLTSNPFARLIPAPEEGHDLNPLLQDPGMVFHPPLLYLGYVGLSVGFSFAVAALIHGHFSSSWVRWLRPWTLLAWVFLTLGITLGSFWAYYELGWGGWWFWDPVENASFMPWLASTALIHSLCVTEKRGALRGWTILLAILSFALSLMGTFLVRSGVLTSIHAFATDPTRGIFILVLLGVLVGGALLLFAWRAPNFQKGPPFSPSSREAMLLANNILLVTALGAISLGTLYPMVLDIFGLGKISVGPPYFEAIFKPLMAPALFLMAIGPLLRWKHAPTPHIATRLCWAFAASAISALVAPMALAQQPVRSQWMTILGLTLAFWIISSIILASIEALRIGQKIQLARAKQLPANFWGMQLAHLGIAIFLAGATLVRTYELQADQTVKIGETLKLGPYQLNFQRVDTVRGPNYQALRGDFVVSKNGMHIGRISPEKRLYIGGQVITEAGIAHHLWGDLYLSMGEPLQVDHWVVRAQIKPHILWIWIGAIITAIGGAVSLCDRRYRKLHRATAPQKGPLAGAVKNV